MLVDKNDSIYKICCFESQVEIEILSFLSWFSL